MASQNEHWQEQVARYDELVASIPDIERKGKTMPYTSCNGHMFSFIDKTGAMSIRLAKDDLEAFLAKHNAELSVQHGSVMKEYAVVPASLFANIDELKPYLQQSFGYVKGLKPKATKKKK